MSLTKKIDPISGLAIAELKITGIEATKPGNTGLEITGLENTGLDVTALGNLNRNSQSVFEQAIVTTQSVLREFAQSDTFLEKVTSTFGNSFDSTRLSSLRESWSSGNFDWFPEIEIRSQQELNGANGAFAASTGKIYLSEEYITHNSFNSGAIVDVILEEIGHFVDASINQIDTAGDEGAVFSAVVQGVELDESTIQRLKTEDDTATIVLDGEVIQVEQAEPTFNIDQINEILKGLKGVLGNLQEKLDEIYKGENLENIPEFIDGLLFFGKNFAEKATEVDSAGQFIQDIYNKIEKKFQDEFENAQEATKSEIQNALFQVLGADGLKILQDLNGDGNISFDDIDIDASSNNLAVNAKLAGTKEILDISLPTELGLPKLGLNFTGDPKLTADLNYSLNLGFGINQDNDFFLSTSPDKELSINLTPKLPQTSATFGFLKVDAKDNGTELKFDIDLDDGNDQKLTLDELNNLNITPTGSADIKLNFLSNIPEATVLPKIGTDLNIQWQFTEGTKPTIQFDNTTIFLDSFLSGFIKPVVDPIKEITNPIQKATGFLTKEIGILKELDLGGQQHNLLGLARQFNPGNSQIDNAIKALEAIEFIGSLSELVNNINTDPDSDIGINLGTVNLDNFDLTANTLISEAKLNGLEKSFAQLKEEFKNQLAGQDPDKFKSQTEFFANADSFADFGLSFPIFEDPKSVIGLLTGQNVDFFKFDVPDFDFSTGIKGSYPIPPAPILKVTFGGEIGAKLNLGFGYDSDGIKQWADSGYKNDEISKIFDGFFLDDNRQNGEDLPELQIMGTLTAGVGADVVVAAGEVNGGIQATVNIDLEDEGEFQDDLGNSDGKIRPSEFKSILSDHPGCLFDIRGQIDAFIGYYARIGWPPFGREWEGELGRTTLADFGIETCPDKKDQQPILANEGPDKFTGGTLDLNIGLRASERKFIDTEDKDEILILTGTGAASKEQVTVNYSGYSQNYLGVNKIVANAGELDDQIYLDNIAVNVEFSGGNGNDILNGGSGSDTIKGDKGDDFIYGSARDENDVLSGNDILSGGYGDDLVVGRGGNDRIFGNEDNDHLLGNGGIDIIDGGAGDDFLDGGNGDDKLYGDTDDSQVGQDILLGDEGNDEIRGFAGDDILAGGNGSDSLHGGSGNDQLVGDLEEQDIGDDFLQGGSGNDSIAGGKGNDTVSYETSLDGTIVNIDVAKGYTSSAFEPTFAIDAAQAQDGFGTTDSFNFSITVDTYDESQDKIVPLTRNVSGELENIIGSNYDDILIGNEHDNKIQALKGNDLLIGNSGNDLLDGGDEIDTVSYLRDPNGVIVNIDEQLNYSNPGGVFHETIVSPNLIPTDTEPNFTINSGTALDGFGTIDTLKNLENIIGSEFDDVLIGNEQNNRIQGADGNDLLVGNAGNDNLEGGNGSDTVSYRRDPSAVTVNLEQNQATDGFGGSDQLSGIENVIGSQFNDEIIGDVNNNTIFAGAGDDIVKARNGNDIIFGEEGKDILKGEEGNDFLVGDEDADILNGGEGSDTASYFTSEDGVYVSLKAGKGLFADAEGDKLTAIENLEGSEFDDFLVGDYQNNIISGLGGDDLIRSEAGDDLLDGGEGSDSLLAGDGKDQLFGQAGEDSLKGGRGDDQLYGGKDDDVLDGGSGNDYLEGGDGADVLKGQTGNDYITGGNGNDKLIGGYGDDYLLGNLGNDQLYATAGNNILNGGAGLDSLHGGYGIDTFVLAPNSGADTIYDFVVGEDYFGLANGLSFEQLSITQGTGSYWSNTLISIEDNNQLVAKLVGVEADKLSASDFHII